jgi:hypothetical protein
MFNTTLSTDIQEMVAEFHASHKGLDAVSTEYALLHDAIHAYCGLGVSMEEEELVHNVTNVLVGQDCLPEHQERVALLIEILPTEVMIELSVALSNYY